jgi:hypothetical protein
MEYTGCAPMILWSPIALVVVRTRNARLAAIKSFMRFVEHRVPSILEQSLRILAIPSKRFDMPLIRYLSLSLKWRRSSTHRTSVLDQGFVIGPCFMWALLLDFEYQN